MKAKNQENLKKLIIWEIDLDYVPIPQLAIDMVVLDDGLRELIKKLQANGIFVGITGHPPVPEQIICGLAILMLDDKKMRIYGASRLKIKEIASVDDEKDGMSHYARAEILDPDAITIAEMSEKYLRQIKPKVFKLCKELNKHCAIFNTDVFQKDFEGVDAFLDQVMSSLIDYHFCKKLGGAGRKVIPLWRQQEFLEETSVDRRALLLLRFLSDLIDFHQSGTLPKPCREEENRPDKIPVKNGKTECAENKYAVAKKTANTHPFYVWSDRLKEAQPPEEVLREARIELNKLAVERPDSSDFAKAQTYLEFVCSLPFRKITKDNLDTGNAASVLDKDHYGLGLIKERIIEHLVVSRLNPKKKGQILCFIGPPGTGKTSLGQSIARAMARRFVRLSLGGLKDESELRGHRRTYIGALPGKILSYIKKIGVNNPVFMLDEIDKVGRNSVHGDPEAALLEILDPAQNATFIDNYLNAPFDLSRVFFITTGNDKNSISPALRDRMEIIEFSTYTFEEKREIAKRHLISKQIAENGLRVNQLVLCDEALKSVIRGYTREAGVRNLEREIEKICRKAAVRIDKGESGAFVVTEENLHEFLGASKYEGESLEALDCAGVAIGMAYTPQGGCILYIETCLLPNDGDGLELTGSLGPVITESAQLALTLVKKNAQKLGIGGKKFPKGKIHLHIPEGATSKDGPSAGVAITVALASLLQNKPIGKKIAMTGEVSLRGAIYAVGGIKEKVLAGRETGIGEFILPQGNEKDLSEIDENIRRELKFRFVKRIEEVFEIIFDE